MRIVENITQLLERILELEQGFKEKLITLTGVLMTLFLLVIILSLLVSVLRILIKAVKKRNIKKIVKAKEILPVGEVGKASYFLLILGDTIQPVCVLSQDKFTRDEIDSTNKTFFSLTERVKEYASLIKTDKPDRLLSDVTVASPLYLTGKTKSKEIKKLAKRLKESRTSPLEKARMLEIRESLSLYV